MMTGQVLINDIRQCSLREGQGAVWWLGQSSFIVKLGDRVIYLDPFLSPHDRRRIPSLLAPRDIPNATLVLGSHDHADHIDRPAWPAIAAASPETPFIVPDSLLPRLAEDLHLPLPRFIGLDDSTCVETHGIHVTGIAAAHEFLDRDPTTGRYPYLGYIIEAHGLRLYHAGDCCVYEGLQTKLSRWTLDLVFLPINGRDARRLASNCIGNMTYQEAADLAGALKPGLTIPMHYDMFERNSENPQLFIDYMRIKYPRLKAVMCQHGTRLIITAARRPEDE